MLETAFLRLFSCRGLVLAALPPLVGCHAEDKLEPAAYVETTYGPAHYPTYEYEGQTVYLIDGRWHYRTPSGGWVYYSDEPPALREYRISMQKAPPASLPPATPPPARFGVSPPTTPPTDVGHDDPRRVPPAKTKQPRYDDRDRREDRDDGDQGDQRYDEQAPDPGGST